MDAVAAGLITIGEDFENPSRLRSVSMANEVSGSPFDPVWRSSSPIAILRAIAMLFSQGMFSGCCCADAPPRLAHANIRANAIARAENSLIVATPAPRQNLTASLSSPWKW